MDYLRLIQRVIDMIEENIGEKILVSDLASAIYCSEAHFSRIFHSIVGMTITDYIRRRRLSLAGIDLAFAQSKVIDTSLKFGYETPEAFAKAFKKFHGVSPIVCKKTCTWKYQERFFPAVIKQAIIKGETVMSNFGSPLHVILDDLDKSSVNLFFCFNFNNTKYALKATEVQEIHSLKGLYSNTKNELCLNDRGYVIPVSQLDNIYDLNDFIERKHNILICRLSDMMNDVYGLICEGNPELKIAGTIQNTKNFGKPYITGIGIFDNEQIPIISATKYYRSSGITIATTFDKSAEQTFNNRDSTDSLNKLENIAYEAELLARNASIEAANGKEHHKGTMVVAYELHRLAIEIAKITHELRDT